MKSEPDVFSLDDLKKKGVSGWDGVRNYQARNFMREMKKGDQVFFYHSSCEVPGIAGVAEVVKVAYPDPSQFDRKSDYFEPRATPDKPVWDQVDLKYVRHLKFVELERLRNIPALEKMRLLQKGSRLSVQPVTDIEWWAILKSAS
jgi:predicted RNA-binding protein with PUA-like domain